MFTLTSFAKIVSGKTIPKQTLLSSCQKRLYSIKERMKREITKDENERSQRIRFPFVTLALGLTSVAIHYKWNQWNSKRAERAFVFSEMNFLANRNYQSLFLCPLSFENNFFFYTNLPGLVYSAYLIEKHLGGRVLFGAYLLNCLASALTTVVVHRKIGYHKV